MSIKHACNNLSCISDVISVGYSVIYGQRIQVDGIIQKRGIPRNLSTKVILNTRNY